MADQNSSEQQSKLTIDRRTLTDAETNRKKRFHELFKSLPVPETVIDELYLELREPYTVVVGNGTVMFRTGPTSTDENGFAKTDFVTEAVESVHGRGLTLAQVDLTNVGALNSDNGPDNTTHLLNAARGGVVKAYKRELVDRQSSLPGASSVRIIPAADGTGMQMFIGHGESVSMADQTRLVGVIEVAAQLGMATQVQTVYEQTDENNVRLLRDLNSTDADIVTTAITQGNLDDAVVEAKALITGESIEAELKSDGSEKIEIGRRSERNYINIDHGRKTAFIAKCEALGVDEEKLEAIYSEYGVHPRDEITGGLIRPDKTRVISQVAEQGPRSKTYYIEIDITNLGGLNKTIGRRNADQIYAWIAQVCQANLETLPLKFVPAKLGGDEFGFFVSVDAATETSLLGVVREMPSLVHRRLENLVYRVGDKDIALMDVEHHRSNPKEGIVREPGTGINVVIGEYNAAARANPAGFFGTIANAVAPLKKLIDKCYKLIEFRDKGERRGTYAAVRPAVSVDDHTRGRYAGVRGPIPSIQDPSHRGMSRYF